MLQTLQLKDVKTMKNQLKACTHKHAHRHTHRDTHTHTCNRALCLGLYLMTYLFYHTLIRCSSRKPDKFTAEPEIYTMVLFEFILLF